MDSKSQKLLIVFVFSLISTSVFAGQIYKTDFTGTNPWPNLSSTIDNNTIPVTASWTDVGTIDIAATSDASKGILLSVTRGSSQAAWGATISSGFLAVTNTVTNLAKLTLSFDHSASVVRPVYVQIESFDSNKNRTGGLEAQVEPAAVDFYIRSAVDLNTMIPFGGGTFSPNDPYIRISFKIKSLPSYVLSSAVHQLRIDNVSYASPTYYVKPTGSNGATGKTEETAFQTIQKAVDTAVAGDIISVMEGTYDGGGNAVANFPRKGTPASWIVLKNYPGHKPKLTASGWNIINIGKGTKTTPWTGETLAYLEVRGLWLSGNGDMLRNEVIALRAAGNTSTLTDGKYNQGGINVNGYYMTNCMHHLRFADNLIEYIPAHGIGVLESDRFQIENNIVRNCCWTNIYGTSNISTLGSANYDTEDNFYKILIRNNISSGARSYELCKVGTEWRITDGNGIIIDVNQNSANRPTETYIGRTLVQSNICFNNGGSGLHAVGSKHIDMINNTAYMNSASPELQYSQIGCYSCQDLNFTNNIAVAPVAASNLPQEPVNRLSGPGNVVTFSNNLYFGGNIAPTLGSGDKVGDPKFINPSLDPVVANFHLQSNSPAIASGTTSKYLYAARLDLDGKDRREGGKVPDIGVYSYSSTKPQIITFNPIENKLSTDADFSLTGTASSGLPVTYNSTNPAVATVTNGQVHIVGEGITIITASQAGNSTFDAAPGVSQSLFVGISNNGGGEEPSSNLILNSTFDTDLSGWGGYREGTTITSNQLVTQAGFAGNVCKINNTNGGTTNWYVQFAYLVPIEAGITYSIKFKASADANRIISFAFQQNLTPKKTYFTGSDINITTTPTTYGPYYFTSNTTDSDESFRFMLGASNISVYLDDIEVKKVVASAIVDVLGNDSGIKAYAVKGGVKIESINSGKFEILNLMGQTVHSGLLNSSSQFIPLKSNGVFIVLLNKKAIKIIVGQ